METRHFREMLENVELIAMTIAKDGTVTFCNDCLLQTTGWTREEVIGADWFSKFIPDSEPEVKRLFFETVEAGAVPPHYENSIQTRQGELRAVHWNNTMLRDAAGDIIGTASIGEDVTERKRAEAALRESEEKFRQLAENITEVFWITDPTKNKILYVSPAYEAIWGQTYDAVVQSQGSWLDVIHPADRRRIADAVVTKQVRGEYDEEYRIIRPDKSVRWIRDRAFPV
jgi:PAS domain S-box-containing protein